MRYYQWEIVVENVVPSKTRTDIKVGELLQFVVVQALVHGVMLCEGEVVLVKSNDLKVVPSISLTDDVAGICIRYKNHDGSCNGNPRPDCPGYKK